MSIPDGKMEKVADLSNFHAGSFLLANFAGITPRGCPPDAYGDFKRQSLHPRPEPAALTHSNVSLSVGFRRLSGEVRFAAGPGRGADLPDALLLVEKDGHARVFDHGDAPLPVSQDGGKDDVDGGGIGVDAEGCAVGYGEVAEVIGLAIGGGGGEELLKGGRADPDMLAELVGDGDGGRWRRGGRRRWCRRRS